MMSGSFPSQHVIYLLMAVLSCYLATPKIDGVWRFFVVGKRKQQWKEEAAAMVVVVVVEALVRCLAYKHTGCCED